MVGSLDMERTIYAHVKAIPIRFPEQITLLYRTADPETNEFTGQAIESDRSWDQIKQIFFMITPEDLAEREAYLKAGDAANMGFHRVHIDVED
jgi:hypothetical protein